MVKQSKFESSDAFEIRVDFQNFNVYFINRYLTVWGITIAFLQIPSSQILHRDKLAP